MLISWKVFLLTLKKFSDVVDKHVFKKPKYSADKQGLDKK